MPTGETNPTVHHRAISKLRRREGTGATHNIAGTVLQGERTFGSAAALAVGVMFWVVDMVVWMVVPIWWGRNGVREKKCDRQGFQLFDRKGMKAKLPTREQSGMPGSRQPNAGGWDSGVGCRWQADDGANIKESRWQKPTVKDEKIR